jgi:hypothetical protein
MSAGRWWKEEEEEEEEEEETATELDSNEVSHENFDMDACDHPKQGLESEIALETQNDPESEVTDGCDPSKSAIDKNEVCHEKFDMDANDQSKQGPEPEIGTENQNGPELEVTDGGDTYINEPGDNIGPDVISPGNVGSDDESYGSTVLPSNPPLSGKALMYQQYLESKQKQEEEKRKKKRNRNKGKMTKKQKKNQEKFLPTAKTRTGKFASRVTS